MTSFFSHGSSDPQDSPPAGLGFRPPRRKFLTTALGIGAGALGFGLAGKPAFAQSGFVTDPDILNFALNLEYLEAEYYTYGLTGAGIQAKGVAVTGKGTLGAVTIKANPMVPFVTPAFRQYVEEIEVDERKHVIFLRSVLGTQAVARPAINLRDSFNTLAVAAGLGASFDPFANELNFLIGAYIFEDVGVSAYRGAAPLIKDKTILSAAAGILGIEAYHAGNVRTILFQQGQGDTTQKISDLRRALGNAVDYGVAEGPLGLGPDGTSSIILADANALAPARTTRQVLNIVYGAQNAAAGLFFPSGMNGTIR